MLANNSQDVKYVLSDGSTRAVIFLAKSSEIGQFLQHNILDTRLLSVSKKKWDQCFAEYAGTQDVSDKLITSDWFQFFNNKFKKISVSDNMKANRIRAGLLARGYETVTNILNHQTTDVYSSTYFLSFTDIMMFPDITELSPQLSYAANITEDTAKKQLIVEKESLLNVYKHRKMCIWKHCMELLSVTSEIEYNKWVENVQVKSSGLGLI